MGVSSRPNLIALALLAAMACTSLAERRTRQPTDGIVMPTSMCARRGEVAASNDAPGNQMMCEVEEVVGSHMPRCICRAEEQIAADRDAAQQARRESESKQPLQGN